MPNSLLSPCAAALLVLALGAAPPLSAQTVPQKTPEQIKASYDARHGEFDYLLGDWEYTANSAEFGQFRGFWSAVRLAEGAQILDEYRVVGDDGETYYSSSTLRSYNAVLDQWELVSAEQGMGLQNVGTARRVGAEMHIEQKFGVMSQAPSIWRIRYYNIQPNRFSWAAERSADGGKTWEKNHMQIEARRIGPPRSLGPLAPARGPDAKASGNADDEDAIRNVLVNHAQAWTAKDLQTAVAQYHSDATVRFASGRELKGRGEIEEWHRAAFASSAHRSSTHLHPLETAVIRFLGPEIAVVDVESVFTGLVDAQGNAASPARSMLVVVFTKQDGAWRVSAQRTGALPAKAS